MRGKCPPTLDFTAWLRGVIQHRQRQVPAQIEGDIRKGLKECLQFGSTLLGDISAAGSSWSAIANAPVRAVVFREVLGLPMDRARRAWEDIAARKDLLRLVWLDDEDTFRIGRLGLSPHAPYSVRDWLFRRIAARARNEHFPVSIHLAESSAELELLEHHSGPFVSFLSNLDVWDPQGLVTSPAEILKAFFGVTALFVHCNYLDASAPIPRGTSIVYCPRTHAAFGHPPHPFREFLARGVQVALGTDSLASNPDLSVLAEARFVHERYPDVAGSTILRMATLSGAEALGWADETGSLTPGKSADLVVLPLPDKERAEPHSLVLESALPVQAVIWRGKWVYSADGWRMSNGPAP